MRLNLFFLTLLFSFTFSKSNAQCPSGDVQLLSQAQVDNFVSTYPNCTHITGSLTFGEFYPSSYDISDISGFSSLTKIDGQLGVFGTQLTNLNGLNNLTELGSLNIVKNHHLVTISELINITEITNGQVQIAENPLLLTLEGLNNVQKIHGRLLLGIDNDGLNSLEALSNLNHIGGVLNIRLQNIDSLAGLESLTYVGEGVGIALCNQLTSIEALLNLVHVNGYIIVTRNPQLTSLNGLQNIIPELFGGVENGLSVAHNGNLITCNLPNICEYLSLDPAEYPRIITENTGNCTDEQAVLAACGLGISDVENNTTNWNVAYQKNKGSFLIQSNGFQLAEIEVYDLSGKLIKSVQNLNSNQEELRVFTPENVLIIKVKSKEGKVLAKKVLMK